MDQPRAHWQSILWLAAVSVAASGCANFSLPRIDPSGRRIFIWDNPPQASMAPPFAPQAPIVVPPPTVAVPPGVAAPPTFPVCPPGTIPVYPAPGGVGVAPPPGTPPAAPGQPTTPLQPTPATPPLQPTPTFGAALDARLTGPDRAVVGQTVRFELEVVNRGTESATGLLVTARFDDGLEHAVARSPIERNLDPIPAGQSATVGITLAVKGAGQQCLTVEVTGDRNLRSGTRTCLTAQAAEPSAEPRPPVDDRPPAPAPAAFSVRHIGPDRRQVGELAEFAIEVTNTGQTAIEQLRIVDTYDPALRPEAASDGYDRNEIAAGRLVWLVANLQPGQTVRRRVSCRCVQPAAMACNRVIVSHGSGAERSEQACLEIVPAAAGNAGQLTLKVADRDDPITVGGTTTYHITVGNQGMGSERQVALTVNLPEQMALLMVNGPTRHRVEDQRILFEPIAELRAGTSVAYEIRARAVRGGAAQLTAELTSQSMPAPLVQTESTNVFLE